MQQGFCAIQFQSTPLTRGETTPCSRFSASQQFQSTPLIRGETCRGWCEAAECINFNPLPSCEGRPRASAPQSKPANFNPLPSHEGRPYPTGKYFRSHRFQSTPLTRGETLTARLQPSWKNNFNPLPSHEGRLEPRRYHRQPLYFNPLPSHEGRPVPVDKSFPTCVFQSTPLTRGETNGCYKGLMFRLISIHSPHTRGDQQWVCDEVDFGISIHSPHTRGDVSVEHLRAAIGNFNPLPSHEGRLGLST